MFRVLGRAWECHCAMKPTLTDSSRGFSQNFYKNFAKFLRNICEIFAKYSRKIRKNFAKKLQKICEKTKFAQNS